VSKTQNTTPELKPLELWAYFDRGQVHRLFREPSTFRPQVGVWGIRGIIELSSRPGDFVLFVTLKASDPTYQFEESISCSGILNWQSQKRSSPDDPVVQRLAQHDEMHNNMHLFLRTKPRRPFAYLGLLRYVSHDTDSKHPVHFKWQLLDWPIPNKVIEDLQLQLGTEHPIDQTSGRGLRSAPPPLRRRQGEGDRRRSFAHRLSDTPRDQQKARTLGLMGEELVVEYERTRLLAAGRADLAERVEHISQTQGDGAGYDILTFSLDGEQRFVEVKTTTGDAYTPFDVTANEVITSQRLGKQYALARVYLANIEARTGLVYFVEGALQDNFTLTAAVFRAGR